MCRETALIQVYIIDLFEKQFDECFSSIVIYILPPNCLEGAFTRFEFHFHFYLPSSPHETHYTRFMERIFYWFPEWPSMLQRLSCCCDPWQKSKRKQKPQYEQLDEMTEVFFHPSPNQLQSKPSTDRSVYRVNTNKSQKIRHIGCRMLLETAISVSLHTAMPAWGPCCFKQHWHSEAQHRIRIPNEFLPTVFHRVLQVSVLHSVMHSLCFNHRVYMFFFATIIRVCGIYIR